MTKFRKGDMAICTAGSHKNERAFVIEIRGSDAYVSFGDKKRLVPLVHLTEYKKGK